MAYQHDAPRRMTVLAAGSRDHHGHAFHVVGVDSERDRARKGNESTACAELLLECRQRLQVHRHGHRERRSIRLRRLDLHTGFTKQLQRRRQVRAVAPEHELLRVFSRHEQCEQRG